VEHPLPSIDYTPSRKRVVRFFLGSLVFTAIAAVLPFTPGHPLKAWFAFVLGVPFFGLCTVFYATRLFDRRPELTITDAGFESRRWGAVPWSEVEIVKVYVQFLRGRTYKFVEVVPKDAAVTLAHVPRGGRLSLKVNRRWSDNILITTNVLPAPIDEIVARMQEAHQRFLGFDPVVLPQNG
jgi:hypothetical protein